jgi:hypothetical protein
MNTLSNKRHTFRNILAAAGTMLAVTVGSLAVGASSAGAVVNQNGAPTHRYTLTGTNCSALVGAVRTTNGAAMGGADVTCGSTHNITATVVLYRWNGSSWATYSSGPWTARSSALYVHTGGVCGVNAQWFERASVTVDGRTYNNLDSNNVTSAYDPPC